jgi:hypothetical protein
MKSSQSAPICQLCRMPSDNPERLRCGECGYPFHLQSGPEIPVPASPHSQFWVASARHKALGDLVAGWLVQIKGFEMKVFDLFLGSNEIGRPSEYATADVLIAGDPLIDREHARINCSLDSENQIHAVLHAYEDTNGTFVNLDEKPIDTHPLRDGDQIRVGDSVLVFKSVYKALDHQDALQLIKVTGWDAM